MRLTDPAKQRFDNQAQLGKRENGTARLQEAVSAYHAALEERTRDRVPLDWAMTQSNLEKALALLSARKT